MIKCVPESTAISWFCDKRGVINMSPSYQRESGAWNTHTERKELFLDTLFNGYDSPKIYLHKMESSRDNYEYALVDGKQRLECIWEFIDDKIKLGQEFKCAETDNCAGNRPKDLYPKAGDTFSNLSKGWQTYFMSLNLAVVFIENAEEEDMDEVFFRLNNGETLKAPEIRNAMGGKMPTLIRELAQEKFFTNIISLKSTRFQHFDVATRFLLIEKGLKDGASSPYRDVKKKFLDELVRDNRNMKKSDIAELKERVQKQLKSLSKVFDEQDRLLKQAGYVQLYYLFIKHMETYYASPRLFANIKQFITDFDGVRKFAKVEDKEDQVESEGGKVKRKGAKVKSSKRQLAIDKKCRYFSDIQRIEERGEFERLMRQGNDKESLRTRVEMMCRFFLLDYPSTSLLDPTRNFTADERYVVYILSGKKCAECPKTFNDFDEFQADHIIQWAHGGQTTLENAQALCISCNASKNSRRG